MPVRIEIYQRQIAELPAHTHPLSTLLCPTNEGDRKVRRLKEKPVADVSNDGHYSRLS